MINTVSNLLCLYVVDPATFLTSMLWRAACLLSYGQKEKTFLCLCYHLINNVNITILSLKVFLRTTWSPFKEKRHLIKSLKTTHRYLEFTWVMLRLKIRGHTAEDLTVYCSHLDFSSHSIYYGTSPLLCWELRVCVTERGGGSGVLVLVMMMMMMMLVDGACLLAGWMCWHAFLLHLFD